MNPYYNGKPRMLNWAQPYQLSPAQYGHPLGWHNQYQGQSSYSRGYATAPSNCLIDYTISRERFPALPCESDDEIRVVGNLYDGEGVKRQTEMLRLGQIQNFGRERRDISRDSNKSYILETKRQKIEKPSKQELLNVNIPTAEQFATKVEIEVINKGEVLPPDFGKVF
ncbi:hypothetical protein QYM36_006191 [Artemia franciscana]|uniref:Uncharacterized protein n=1 Tax=Artemia franciscana TaxID=6661 RepID=A0AA88I8K0_ARTSF|nr:hypothetical protein QYM36_006191 [Artemia franciscana]